MRNYSEFGPVVLEETCINKSLQTIDKDRLKKLTFELE